MRSEIGASIFPSVCAKPLFFFLSIGSFTKKESMWTSWREETHSLPCARVSECVFVCVGPCCVDSCQWQSDASQRAHVRDYVRNWTGHSVMGRLTILVRSKKKDKKKKRKPSVNTAHVKNISATKPNKSLWGHSPSLRTAHMDQHENTGGTKTGWQMCSYGAAIRFCPFGGGDQLTVGKEPPLNGSPWQSDLTGGGRRQPNKSWNHNPASFLLPGFCCHVKSHNTILF